MNLKRTCLLLALPLFLQACSTMPQSSHWLEAEAANTNDGIAVYLRHKEDSSMYGYRGIVDIPQSAVSVMAVLADVKHYPQWLYKCTDAEMKPQKWGINKVRLVLASPWPLSDRDVILGNSLSVSPTAGTITISSDNAKGVVAPRPGFVRIPKMQSEFVLKPLGVNKTRVTYQVDFNPGGKMPDWMASIFSHRAPDATLRGLRQQASLDRYHVTGKANIPTNFSQLLDLLPH